MSPILCTALRIEPIVNIADLEVINEVAGEKVEVVVATASEAAQLAIPGDAGVYIVGTGNTGAAGAFLTLGIVYFIINFESS